MLPGVDIYDFYPRCYDLSDAREIDLFQDDFNRTAILSCLKKHAKYFKANFGVLLKEIYRKDSLIPSYNKQGKRQLKRDCIGQVPGEQKMSKVNTILLRNALFYGQNLL